MRVFTDFNSARLYACAASYLTRQPTTLHCRLDSWEIETDLFADRIRNEICTQTVLRVALKVREVWGSPKWLIEARLLTEKWWDDNCRTNAQAVVMSLSGQIHYRLSKVNPSLFYTRRQYEDLCRQVKELERSEADWSENWNDPTFREDWRRQEELGYRWEDDHWELEDPA